MKHSGICISILAVFICMNAAGQVPVEESKYAVSKIAPKYFGPYAFPVPDMLDARISDKLLAGVSMDFVTGTLAGNDAKDRTKAPTFRLSIPMWTDRVALSVWGEIFEWYEDTPKTREMRRVDPGLQLKRYDAGNIYFSFDILALREKKFIPSVTLRAAMQTASGDDYEYAHHYDAPGYFFDAAVGKSFKTGKLGSIRVSASSGLLCWQVDRGRQNDALMLATQLSYNHKYFDAIVSYAQYSGREMDGDRPKVVKARLDARIGRFIPFVYVQHGFEDWPFTMFRFGVEVSFDILKKMKAEFNLTVQQHYRM